MCSITSFRNKNIFITFYRVSSAGIGHYVPDEFAHRIRKPFEFRERRRSSKMGIRIRHRTLCRFSDVHGQRIRRQESRRTTRRVLRFHDAVNKRFRPRTHQISGPVFIRIQCVLIYCKIIYFFFLIS